MSERMKKYVAAQKKRGFKMVAIWVPQDKIEGLRKTVARWRADALSGKKAKGK